MAVVYTPITKDKYVLPAPSSTRYSGVRRLLPKYIKGYLYLCFLCAVFGTLLLSDNGYSVFDYIPSFSPPVGSSDRPQAPAASGQIDVNTTTASDYGFASIPSSHVPTSTVEAIQQVTAQQYPTYGTGHKSFTPEDVVILFKTGATALWRRVPMHLSTSLANQSMTPNVVLYSDQADSIAGQPVIDVLADVSETLKNSSDFELYRSLPSIRPSNLYLESAAIDGDHYLGGGWRLDKYKFLPLVAHAAKYHPGKKWYVYMEDDNYFFWHSLYTWLGSNFSPSEPLYLGSPAAKLGEDFAHGGSGFVVSGAAMEKTFGSDPDLASKYESYAAAHCCGDQVLSHVMAAKGVPRYRKYDHSSFVGLQALQSWKMAFGQWNWCSPLLNVHKVHQADISRLHEFEEDFHGTKGYTPDAVMDWSYLFQHFVGPDMFEKSGKQSKSAFTVPAKTIILDEWDNLAAEKWFTSDITIDENLTDAEREKKPWFSAEGCEEACQAWDLCLSWKFQDDNCGMSSTISAGNKANEGVKMVSGYMGKRIKKLVESPDCGRSKYIPL